MNKGRIQWGANSCGWCRDRNKRVEVYMQVFFLHVFGQYTRKPFRWPIKIGLKMLSKHGVLC